jgi:hypothetical protein
MITFTEKGSFKNTERYLSRLKSLELNTILNKYVNLVVNALSNDTPNYTSIIATSLYFETLKRK